MLEKWINIPDIGKYYGYYKVSSLGRIKRIEHYRQNRNQHGSYDQYYPELIMKNGKDKDGYMLVTIGKYTKKIHRLVGLFIENDNPDEKTHINHINGIKDDNRVGNLEWSTPASNYQHAFDTGLNKGPLGTKNGNSKLCRDDVISIKWLLENSDRTQKSIADQFNITPSTVSGIKLGKAWSHVTKYPYRGRIKKHQGHIK